MSNSLARLIDGFVPVCCFVSLRVFHTNTLELRARTLAVSDSQSVNTFFAICQLPRFLLLEMKSDSLLKSELMAC